MGDRALNWMVEWRGVEVVFVGVVLPPVASMVRTSPGRKTKCLPVRLESCVSPTRVGNGMRETQAYKKTILREVCALISFF